MPKRTCYVYALLDPVSHEPFMVGVTQSPKTRRRAHVAHLRRTTTDNPEAASIVRGLIKRNLEPTMLVLETTTDDRQFDCERKWQKTLKRRGCKLLNGRINSRLSKEEEFVSVGINYQLLVVAEHALSVYESTPSLSHLVEPTRAVLRRATNLRLRSEESRRRKD